MKSILVFVNRTAIGPEHGRWNENVKFITPGKVVQRTTIHMRIQRQWGHEVFCSGAYSWAVRRKGIVRKTNNFFLSEAVRCNCSNPVTCLTEVVLYIASNCGCVLQAWRKLMFGCRLTPGLNSPEGTWNLPWDHKVEWLVDSSTQASFIQRESDATKQFDYE